jgi:PAS domain S-box-containing protein
VSSGASAKGGPDFETLAEMCSVAIFIVQGDRFRYVNPSLARISGYTEAELYEMPFWDFVHPDDREAVRERGLGRQRGEEVPTRYQFRICTKDGEERWGEFSGTLIDFEGQPAVLGTAFDITAAKRAKDALTESEVRYRTIFEKNVDGIAIIVDGRIVNHNQRLADLMGRSDESLIGRSPAEFTAPDEGERVAERIRTVEEGGPEFRSEYRVQCPDGSTLPIEVLSSQIQYEGAPAVLSMVRDVTERVEAAKALRASEERFRRLVETAGAAIFLFQKDRFTYMNPAAERLLGFTLDEVGAGANAWDFIHPDDRAGLRDRTARRDAGEEVTAPYQFRVVRKDGEERWVESTATTINIDGETQGLSFLIDITERVHAQEALEKNREELEGRVERTLLRRNPYQLSFRELTVLHLIAAGRADKEIGYELGISPLTAQKHVSNILAKMNASSRTEASVRAVREGLLE